MAFIKIGKKDDVSRKDVEAMIEQAAVEIKEPVRIESNEKILVLESSVQDLTLRIAELNNVVGVLQNNVDELISLQEKRVETLESLRKGLRMQLIGELMDVK